MIFYVLCIFIHTSERFIFSNVQCDMVAEQMQFLSLATESGKTRFKIPAEMCPKRLAVVAGYWRSGMLRKHPLQSAVQTPKYCD